MLVTKILNNVLYHNKPFRESIPAKLVTTNAEKTCFDKDADSRNLKFKILKVFDIRS